MSTGEYLFITILVPTVSFSSISNSIVFNPAVRIYNLRVLLLVTVALIPAVVISLPSAASAQNSKRASFYDEFAPFTGLVSCFLIMVHQVGRLFRPGLNAVYDWFMTFFLICAVAYFIGIWHFVAPGVNVTLTGHVLQLVALLLSQACATATIMKSPQKVIIQRFEFLGGCRKSETYTAARILLNRSVSRPLVRGEYPAIPIVRGVILSIFCLLFPAIAVYNIIISPLHTQVFTRQIRTTVEAPSLSDQPLQLTIALWGISLVFLNNFSCIVADASEIVLQSAFNTTNGIPVPPRYLPSLWNCELPQHLGNDSAGFVLSFSLPQGVLPVIYAQIGQGNNFQDIIRYADPISLFPGTHIAATLTWTQYQVIPPGPPALLGSLAPLKLFIVGELHTVQPDPRSDASTSKTSATLFIIESRIEPTRFIQEYTESSVITGFATVGGFWTFMNGAFAMFFWGKCGLFPIREKATFGPWDRAFVPATPAAFLRERFVDLDDDDSGCETDLEAQNQSSAHDTRGGGMVSKDEEDHSNFKGSSEDSHTISADSDDSWRCKGGYSLDEIALMDEAPASERDPLGNYIDS
ncbi:Short-chain dehydrogenase/reductase family protein [Mycena venus]|uniref:Short-chain dehydrogenase/reductase family protein n=1 Tax=Mycena venus TaxID=2733690 RepID=A0A8H6XI08_9AGAR|nr:Short-chain dehydrogenase/reductase family protein [Mycena venus]